MSQFCYLEKDKKTFKYFKKYVEFLETHTDEETCLILDNEIQVEELNEHLKHNDGRNKHSEINSWIHKNAKGFREYLNTIKLVYVVWKCMGYNWKDIKWSDFTKISDNLNGIKSKCLDTIF